VTMLRNIVVKGGKGGNSALRNYRERQLPWGCCVEFRGLIAKSNEVEHVRK
jgi:hypothetical protein